MLEINFRWADLHESGDRSGGSGLRSAQYGAGPILRNAHVLLRADVCVFVGEFEPGQPVAAGKRNHIAELNIGGETGFVSVEVEKGAALLPLGNQHRPIKHIYGAGYALKRLVETGPVKTSAHTDIEPRPVPNSWRCWQRSFDGHIRRKDSAVCCDD